MQRQMHGVSEEPVPGHRLLRFLGRGSFGEVWEAVGPGGTRKALKFISLDDRGGLKEFRAVQCMKLIRHVHLVEVLDIWAHDENGKLLTEEQLSHWAEDFARNSSTLVLKTAVDVRPARLIVAMQLGDKDLSKRLEECKAEGLPGIGPEELLRYLEDASRAIDFLNTRHHQTDEGLMAIQHGDIKPQNILIRHGAAQVCDFGLARVMGDSITLTRYAGSPAYSAPECFENKTNLYTDQYALAITYVELRTGALPFPPDANRRDVEIAHTKGQLDLSRLPPAERAVIRKATSVQPRHRFATTQQMVDALKDAVSGKAPAKSRLPLLTANAIGVLLIVLGAAGFYLWPMFVRPSILAVLVEAAEKPGTIQVRVDSRGKTGHYSYRVDEGPWKASPSDAFVVADLGPGAHRLDVFADDARGYRSNLFEQPFEVPAPPTAAIQVVRVVPEQPVAGDTLHVYLEDTDTQLGPLRFEYRTTMHPAWAPADAAGQITLSDIHAGVLELEVRVTNVPPASATTKTFTWKVRENQPPKVAILSADPADPAPGGSLVVKLRGSDPDPDDAARLKLEYRTSESQPWQPVGPDQQVTLDDLESGPLSLFVMASDGHTTSPVVSRTWDVRSEPYFTNSLGMRLVRIAAGEFMMGTPRDQQPPSASDETQHLVRIEGDFYLGAYEVTQGEYEQVMGMNPSAFQTKEPKAFPVEMVSWRDAVEFCRRLSLRPAEQKKGRTYRLPTEAEWEYACRAGTQTRFNTGDELKPEQANFGRSLDHPTRVGNYPPNAFGLYDMHGNVFEWCSDAYSKNFEPVVGADQAFSFPRVDRGGGFDTRSTFCRSASRDSQDPDARLRQTGFRVACDVQDSSGGPAGTSKAAARAGPKTQADR